MDYGSQIKHWDDLQIGNSASFTKTITETDVILWVGLTGDLNPIHIDKEYAATTQFNAVLVPGVMVMGLISAAVTKATFGNVYARQSVKFTKPVYVGDTITAIATIIDKIEAKSMVKLETKCLNQKKEVVMIGEGMEFIIR